MFHDLKHLLGDALKRHDIERPVTTSQIVDAANAVLASLLPPGRSADARAISCQNGTITVQCANGAAGQLIHTKTSDLLNAIKRTVPKADIQNVRVIIGG